LWITFVKVLRRDGGVALIKPPVWRWLEKLLLQPGSNPQCLRFVGALPGELGLLTTKMTVGGGLFIDRAQEVEHLDDAFAVHVAHGDLALGVGAQKRQVTVFAQLPERLAALGSSENALSCYLKYSCLRKADKG
jgi:hypothetical protein